MFRAYLWPIIRRCTVYLQQLVCVVLFSWQSVGWVGMELVPPDDGLQMCMKRVEVDWRNKLRINCASNWFLLHRYVEMHGQQNIKFKISTFKPTVCYFKFIFIVTLIITLLKGRRVKINLCLYFHYLGTECGEISCWRLSGHYDTEWFLVLWHLVQWKP
jgi:hypothetical protein